MRTSVHQKVGCRIRTVTAVIWQYEFLKMVSGLVFAKVRGSLRQKN